MTGEAVHGTGVDAPVAGSWMRLYEDLLGGIIHSINNTFTVIDVSLELATTEDAARELAAVRGEMTRLEGLVAHITTLLGRSAAQEALEIRPIMDVVLTLHAFDNVTRMVPHTLRITGDVPPVRASYTALLRMMLMITDDAKRAVMTAGGTAEIEIDGNPERVRIRAPGQSVPRRDVLQLAAACGGTFVVADGVQVLELPSLQAVRRQGTTATPQCTITPKRAAES